MEVYIFTLFLTKNQRKSIKISKMHKNVFICKNKSKFNAGKFSTYPH